MQSCTRAWGKTLSIASGNPVSPSTQAIKIFLTPRFCSSVSTATRTWPLILRESHAQEFLVPAQRHSQSQIHGFVTDALILFDLDDQAVQTDNRVNCLQRAALPLPHLLHHRLMHVGDHLGGDHYTV